MLSNKLDSLYTDMSQTIEDITDKSKFAKAAILQNAADLIKALLKAGEFHARNKSHTLVIKEPYQILTNISVDKLNRFFELGSAPWNLESVLYNGVWVYPWLCVLRPTTGNVAQQWYTFSFKPDTLQKNIDSLCSLLGYDPAKDIKDNIEAAKRRVDIAKQE